MKEVSIQELLEAGAHFGSKKKYRHPKMKYVFAEKSGIHIIDLQQTKKLATEAAHYIHGAIKSDDQVLFVGTKTFAKDIIKAQAERCGMPYVNFRWLGGMLTNYKTIKESITRLKNLEKLLADEAAPAVEGVVKKQKFTKKELLMMSRDRDKLNQNFSGIKDMISLPKTLFIVDVKKEHIALMEAKRLGIQVIGLVDTNSSPEHVAYPIPANDDGLRSIELLTGYIANAIIDAKANHQAELAKVKVTAPAKPTPEVRVVPVIPTVTPPASAAE
jgi:small subunit ribosomal protein S2